MGVYKYIFLLNIILFFSLLQAHAKLKPVHRVTIDPITFSPDSYMPFDEEFYLEIPIDTIFKFKNIKNIFLYIMKNDIEFYQKKNDTKVYSLCSLKTDVQNFEITGKRYNSLTLIIPPLPPKEKFSIVLNYSTPDYIVQQAIQLNLQEFIGDKTKAGEIHKLFSNSIDEINGKLSNILNMYTRYRYLDTCIATFKSDKIDSLCFRLQSNIENNAGLTNSFRKLLSFLQNADLCNHLYTCNCAGTFIVSERDAEMEKLFNQLCRWNKIAGQENGDAYISALLQGKITFLDADKILLDTSFCYETSVADNYELFIENMERNIKLLASMNDFILNNSYMSTFPQRDSIVKYIYIINTTTRKNIEASHNLLNELSQKLIKVVDKLGNTNTLLYDFFQSVAFKHDAPDIKTAFGNYLIPDIGLITSVAFSESKPKVVVRPYWGLNISFRPINKNSRFKKIQFGMDSVAVKPKILTNKLQNFLMRTSLSVGFTAIALDKSISKGGDLFANMSFVNGLNFRINRMLRVGAGYILYRNDKSNPELKKSLTAMPYISCSIDLDIVDWISKLTGNIY